MRKKERKRAEKRRLIGTMMVNLCNQTDKTRLVSVGMRGEEERNDCSISLLREWKRHGKKIAEYMYEQNHNPQWEKEREREQKRRKTLSHTSWNDHRDERNEWESDVFRFAFSFLHRFEFIDTLLRIALSNHFQCFVFVSTWGDILLMQPIVISHFLRVLNWTQFIFQCLKRAKSISIFRQSQPKDVLRVFVWYCDLSL